mgnify:CR=1 FL=1|jgi:hypothetical protein
MRANMCEAAPPQEGILHLVERTMPLMAPAEYEETLQQWATDGGLGSIVRWYISRVDEASATVTAEVVLLPSVASTSPSQAADSG